MSFLLLIFLFCHLCLHSSRSNIGMAGFPHGLESLRQEWVVPVCPVLFSSSHSVIISILHWKCLCWKCFSPLQQLFFKTLLSGWLWGHLILLLFMTKILVLLQIYTFLPTSVASGRFTNQTKIRWRLKINK